MPLPGCSGLYFSSTHSLDILKIWSDSQLNLLPFLASVCPSSPFFLPGSLYTVTPPPSFRDPYVLGNGISWSLLIIVGHFMPSPTHTLSLHTALARSLEKEQNRPCSLAAPSPLSSPPPSLLTPPTAHFCPLSFAQGGTGESPVSVQPVWWCWGFPLILHCFLHHLPPLPPAQPPATITTNPVTDFPIDHSSLLLTSALSHQLSPPVVGREGREKSRLLGPSLPEKLRLRVCVISSQCC